MNEFQDLINLAQLNIIDEHLNDKELTNSISKNDIIETKNVLNYKRERLANKIISKTEVQDEVN